MWRCIVNMQAPSLTGFPSSQFSRGTTTPLNTYDAHLDHPLVACARSEGHQLSTRCCLFYLGTTPCCSFSLQALPARFIVKYDTVHGTHSRLKRLLSEAAPLCTTNKFGETLMSTDSGSAGSGLHVKRFLCNFALRPDCTATGDHFDCEQTKRVSPQGVGIKPWCVYDT